jgi:hypothetical protein
VLAVSSAEITDGTQVVLTWHSASNRQYSVRMGTNLSGVWSVTASNIPATPPLNYYTNSASPAPSYYGIQLE